MLIVLALLACLQPASNAHAQAPSFSTGAVPAEAEWVGCDRQRVALWAEWMALSDAHAACGADDARCANTSGGAKFVAHAVIDDLERADRVVASQFSQQLRQPGQQQLRALATGTLDLQRRCGEVRPPAWSLLRSWGQGG